MPGVGGTAVPSLSHIVNWDVAHLELAASDWTNTATQWEEHFDALHRGTMSPGGTIWEGKAADAAQDGTFADLVQVRGVAQTLHDAASVARRGADQLGYARRSALNAVSDAEDAGFVVGDDLSVASPRTAGGPLADAQRAALAQ